MICFLFPVSVSELYSESEVSVLKLINLENAQSFLENSFSAGCQLSEIVDGRSSCIPYIEEFLKEKTEKNLYEFLIRKWSCKRIEVNMKFLSNFKTDVEKMCENEDWKKRDIEQQAVALETYVRDFHADLYGLRKSSWKPVQGIDKLIEELKEKGPLMVSGFLGASAYKDLPFKMKKQIGDRDIYAWPQGAKKEDSTAGHSILLVGAKKNQDQSLIYFIDSHDPSDPKDRSKQKIYAISLANLTSNICTLAGHKDPNSSSEYAYYGNFKI